MKIINYKLLLSVLLIVICVQTGSAQYYFEKNKVQYQDFHFKTLQTEHFLIYFYDGGENLAEYTSKYAEDYFKQLSADLQLVIKDKIPVIVYNSPSEFEQTNIVTELIDEAVGGFSELFKNRVVVPFNGSYFEFKHVIEHEITHIFEFEMFYHSQVASILTLVSEFQIPLWVTEGFSEYMSQESQSEIGSEIFLRDFVINNRFVPLDQLSDGMGYINYRIGEEFYRYVALKYDRKKIFEFLHNLKNKRNLESAFKVTFGMPMSEFSKKFEEYLKIKYWPQVVKKDNFTAIARLLTDHKKDASIYNTAPAISPSGTKIAFISDRNGYADIYVISAIDGKILHHLIKGERSGGFESFHISQGGISWSSDEKFLVLIAKSHGKDNIVVVNYPSGKTVKRLRYNLDGIYSPNLSTDNKSVCFVGLKNGYADIYTAELKNGALNRITYDYYEDRDPSFTSDNKSIIFVSDRPDFDSWQPGAYALFQISLTSQNNNEGNNSGFTRAVPIERITGIPRSQYLAKPTITSDGYLVFTAADSSYNVYLYKMSDKKITNRTDFAGGVYYPSISNDNNKLVFSYYNDYGWDIGVIDEPMKGIPILTHDSLDIAQEDWQKYEPAGIDQSKISAYKFALSPDYAIGQASYSTQGGAAGQLYVALSDALGNHRFYLVTDLYQDISNSDIYLNYWNLQKRVNWGLALEQYFDYPIVEPNTVVIARYRGLGALTSYPLDKFSRFELGAYGYFIDDAVMNYYDDYGWLQTQAYHEKLMLLSEAYVFDNTVWNEWGAYKGTRMRIGTNQAMPISSQKFYTGYLDLRNYIKISTRYSFATWLYGVGSLGPDPEYFSLLSTTAPDIDPTANIRGYNYEELYYDIGSKMAIASMELRHPFIDKLKLAFPIPIELTDIRGVTFLDAGIVFNDTTKIYSTDVYTDTLGIQHSRSGFRDLKLGVGVGIRMQLSYFLLKFDFAKPLSITDDKGWKFHFGIGTDF